MLDNMQIKCFLYSNGGNWKSGGTKEMAQFLTVVVLFFGLLSSGIAGTTCTCIYKGGKVQEGETACIWTAKGDTLARCEKVLNNTSWKLLNLPCLKIQSSVHDPTSHDASG